MLTFSLQFEREEGSLEAWEQCRKQCRARLARVEASKGKEKEKGMDEEARKADKVERKKEKDKTNQKNKERGTHDKENNMYDKNGKLDRTSYIFDIIKTLVMSLLKI